MHGDYVNRTIVKSTDIYYFVANNYDKYYDLSIDSCVSHETTPQYHDHNLLPYKFVQISKRDVQPKELYYNSL